MLPQNQNLVQHQYPNFNHPSVLTQSQNSPDTSIHVQHSYSQMPTSSPVQYIQPSHFHDHGGYTRSSYNPSLHVQPPFSNVYTQPQHGGAFHGSPVPPAHSSLRHGTHPYSVQHFNVPGSPMHHSGSPRSSGVSNVNPHSPVSSTHYVGLSVDSSNSSASIQTRAPSVPANLPHTDVSPVNVANTSSSDSEAMLSEDFTKVKRKGRPRNHSISSSGSNDTVTSKKMKGNQKIKTPNPAIKLSNRYSALSKKNDSVSNDDNDENQVEPKIKIPPIFISKNSITVGDLLKSLKALNPDFSLKDSKDSLRLESGSIDCYRAFCSLLDNKNVEYHSYRLPQNKTIDVMIKHVPTDFGDQEIADELKYLGYSDFKLMRVWDKSKKPIPVISVYLNNSVKNQEIYNLDKLLNCIVLVEPKRRSRNIPQCCNCQRYGHTKNYCKLAPRCMFCTDNHLSSECDKMKEENQVKVCVNCGENHSANYRGCTYYADLKRRRFKNAPQAAAEYQYQPPPDINSFPPLPHNQSSMVPAMTSYVREHSYAGVASTSSTYNHLPMSHLSTPPLEPSQSIHHSDASDNYIPAMDSLADTLISALKPLFEVLMNKLKPIIHQFILQVFNGLR